jgi:transposase, IS30 family
MVFKSKKLNKMTNKHLTPENRTIINQLKGKFSVTEIAKRIGRHFSTVYRELKRNALSQGGYCPRVAQDLADDRKEIPRRPTSDTAENRDLIAARLPGLTPDLISGRLRLEATAAKAVGKEPEQKPIGTSSIYKIIARDRKSGGSLYLQLPRQGRKYRKHGATAGRKKAGKLDVKPEQELPTRPLIIECRDVPGHFEMDLMFSGETIWLTGVDRCTRKTILRPLESKDSQNIAAEIFHICSQERIRSITLDRGLEWAKLNTMVVDLLDQELSLYFCAAYRSWEKGSIENLNRLLRRYFPKGENLPWTEERRQEAQAIQDKMNNRPRKSLGYRTPLEVEAEWTDKRLHEAWKAMMIPPLPAVA